MAVGANYGGYLSALYGSSTYSGMQSLYNRNQAQSGGINALLDAKRLGNLNTLLGREEEQGVGLSTSYGRFMREYVVEMKGGAADLKSAMSDLAAKSGPKSIYTQSTVSSSDESGLAVKSSGTVAAKADKKILIEQVATGQINEGKTVKSDANAGMSGYYQIEVRVGGKTHQISFEASKGDTNQAVQQKMADAINSRNIGVKATLSKGNGNSSLAMRAENTGDDDKAKFTVRDVSGNAAALMEADTKTQDARDAIYRVDQGPAKTSKSNEVDLGDGISATLIKASAEYYTVTAKQDSSKAVNGLKAMVESFNGLLKTADSSNGVAGSKGGDRLRKDLTAITKTYSSSLRHIGINVDSKGYLSIDGDKAAKAVESGDTERFLTGGGSANYGFSGRMTTLANNISRSPGKYINDVFPSMHYTLNQGLMVNLTI